MTVTVTGAMERATSMTTMWRRPSWCLCCCDREDDLFSDDGGDDRGDDGSDDGGDDEDYKPAMCNDDGD